MLIPSALIALAASAASLVVASPSGRPNVALSSRNNGNGNSYGNGNGNGNGNVNGNGNGNGNGKGNGKSNGKGPKTSTHPQVTIKGNTCTVKPLGGAEDDSSALLYAFNELCQQDSTIDLPGAYVVGKVLNTTLSRVTINLSGTIQYTPSIEYWSPNSVFLGFQNATTAWSFGGQDVLLTGGGTIDGNGQVWWEAFAQNGQAGVAGGSSRVFARPIPLAITYASRITVRDIKIIQSPFWSSIIYRSKDVLFEDISYFSASNNKTIPPKNTDALDIYNSDRVTIRGIHAVVGDDCVSMKPNSTNILIENAYCEGTHGISIGSLGQYAAETDIVAHVVARNVTMAGGQNGARIKVFAGGNDDPNSVSGGGTGYVTDILFSDFVVENIDYPIVIDQCYMTSAADCKTHPAKLSISDVHYVNFSGSSSGKLKNNTVVDLECSALCKNVTAENVNLSPPNGTVNDGNWICVNIEGTPTSLGHACSTKPLKG